MKITVKCYSDNYRLDLSFVFTDSEKQVYKTTSTLELVNIKAKDKKREVIANAGIKGRQVNISDHDQAEAGYKIYYKMNGALKIVDDPDYQYPDVDYDGSAFEDTVYNELICRDASITKSNEAGNNKGVWPANHDYKKGGFVDYLGATYRAVKDVRNGSDPLTNYGSAWKPINPSYWMKGVSCETGDTVICQVINAYCQATVQVHNSVEPPDNNKQKWHRLNMAELNEIIEGHRSKDFCDIDNKDEGDWTAGGEKARCDAPEKQWNVGQVIEPGDYVEDPMNPGQWYRYVHSSPL